MNTQSLALPDPGRLGAARLHPHRAGQRGLAPFLRHFGQMFVAMMLGMGFFAVLPLRSRDMPELYALLMAVSMAVPMLAWMHVRGHSRGAALEMAAAMVGPVVALLPLLWLGLMSGRMLVSLEHVLMLPSMLAAMVYRRNEYGL